MMTVTRKQFKKNMDSTRDAYRRLLLTRSFVDQVKSLGCYWDAREEGLRGHAALSVALSCHFSHGGGIGSRGLTGV